MPFTPEPRTRRSSTTMYARPLRARTGRLPTRSAVVTPMRPVGACVAMCTPTPRPHWPWTNVKQSASTTDRRGGERRRCRRHGKAGSARGGSVFATTSSILTPGAVSIRCRPSSATSMTARSVKIRFTQRLPVSGSVQCSTIFALPSLAVCSIITKTCSTPCSRSIAPPMPLIILPGTVQLARSPAAETCMAPSTAMSRCPPRMIPNEDDEQKNAAPGNVVTVSLPALIRSASRFSRRGYGPTPRMPFSECKTTVMPAGMWLGIRVGNPTPRLTYCPSCSSAATRAASSSPLQLTLRHSSSSLRPPQAGGTPTASSSARSWPHRLLFDLLHRVGHMHHPVHVDPRGVHLGGVDLARFDQVLNLRDGEPARYGTVWVEVRGRRMIDQVAVPVAFEGVHQCEVSADGSFQHVSDPVEFAGLLRRRGNRHRTVWVVPPRETAVGHLRPNPRGGVEGGDPGPAGAQR